MLFTDGLYEVEGVDNQQFSQSMLMDVLKKEIRRPTCSELFDVLLEEIRQFSATNAFADDVCMVGMDVTENLK